MNIPSGEPSGPRAIGILSSVLDSPYSIQIARATAQRLAYAGYNAMTFTGGFPTAPLFIDREGYATVPLVLQGLVVVAASLREFGPELKRLSARSRVPIVSIGAELPKASCINVDDQTGVLRAMAHLVKQHDARRVAFIAGPEESVDGARRFSAYRAALESFQLPWDPTLVARGDYEASSGREAIRCLRAQSPGGFDALVAANDLMAIGAIEELQSLNIGVPEKVKVVGFDDMEEASFVRPSLSTVRQPISEQGVSAADVLVQRIAQQSPRPESVSITTPLIIRKSCGCSPRSGSRSSARALAVPEDQELVHEAVRSLVRREMAARRAHRELSHLTERIIGAPGLPELADVMTDVVRLLRVQRMLLCRYDGNQVEARVVLESRGRDVVFRSGGESFPVSQVVPEGFLNPKKPSHFWIEPLELAREQLGYIVLEAYPANDQPYLELRHLLSSALGRISLVAELRRLYASERVRARV